jgi:nucleoside-diphosphate-sugar epimerase
MAEHNDTIVITCSSGLIGEALVAELAASYNVIGLDLRAPKELPDGASFQQIDLTSDTNVRQSLQKIRKSHGSRRARSSCPQRVARRC